MSLNRINELLSSSLTTDGVKEISTILKGLDISEKAQALEKIRIVREKIEGQTKTQLDALISEIEGEQNKTSFSLETLGRRTESKIFAPLLKEANGFLYTSIIKSILPDRQYETLPKTAQESLSVTLWPIILKNLSLSGIFNSIVNKAKGEALELKGLVDVFNSSGDSPEKSTPTEHTKVRNSLISLLKEEASGVVTQDKIEDLKNIQEFIKTLITKEVGNFISFIQTAREKGIFDTDHFKQALENPALLTSVMKTGKYEQDGTRIDLEKKELTLVQITSAKLNEIKDSFIKSAVDLSNKEGKNFDSLFSKAQTILEKVSGIAEKLGITGLSFKGILETLYSIPIIGTLAKIIFGGFFSHLQSGLDLIGMNKELKASIQNFMSFSAEHKDSLPFQFEGSLVKKFEGLKRRNDYAQVESFIKTVKKAEGPISSSVTNEKDFWETLFSDKPLADDSVLGKTRKVVKKRVESLGGKKPTQEIFLTFLGSISKEEIEKINSVPTAPIETKKPEAEVVFPMFSVTNESLKIGDTPYELSELKIGETVDSKALLSKGVQEGPFLKLFFKKSDGSEISTSLSLDDVNTLKTKGALEKIEKEVNISLKKKVETPLLKVEEATVVPPNTEVQNEPSFSEQIQKIASFPAEVTVEGKKYQISFDIDKKELKINDTTYKFEVTPQIAEVKNILFSDGKIFLEYINIFRQTEKTEVTSDFLEELFRNLIGKNTFKKSFPLESFKNAEIQIEVSPIV